MVNDAAEDVCFGADTSKAEKPLFDKRRAEA